MEWALCLPWLYCCRGAQWYSWETVRVQNLARNIYSGPEMSVYSHRKQRYCVGGCCSPQLHKIPVLELIGTHLFRQVLPCREGGVAGVWQPSCPCTVPSSDNSAQSSFPWARDTGGAALGSAACHAAPCSWGRLTCLGAFLVCRDPTESWS